MNEFIKSVLTALRSNKYKQGRGKLRSDNDEFCCIGVMADLLDSNNWTPAPSIRGYAYDAPRYGECAFAPNAVIQATKFSGRFFNALMTKNDGEKLTFPQIADYIEESVNDGTAFQ